MTARRTAARRERGRAPAPGGAAERGSEHPLAEAIVRHADGPRPAERVEATAFEAIAGRGVRATVDGATVLVGTARIPRGPTAST